MIRRTFLQTIVAGAGASMIESNILKANAVPTSWSQTLGVVPVVARKAWVKWLWFAKPAI
jgi:hypothetical protein